MNLFKTILRVVLVLTIVVIAVFAVIKMQNRSCGGIKVFINYQGENPILTEKDIIKLIDLAQIKIVNQKLKTIPLERIKQVLSSNIYITKINQINFSGTQLVINVTLREILLHVFLSNNSSFFIDYEGIVIPYTDKIKEKLFIVNGNFKMNLTKNQNILEKSSSLKSIFFIASQLIKDPYMVANFKQIYLNDKNIIELIPIDGNTTILFGDEVDVNEKIFKIKEIYSNVLPFSGEKKYKLIDVRFKNRVIANKENI
jgi:cell division protein FtsQ